MYELLMSLGVFMLLFAVSTGVVFLMNYFFPSMKQHLPEGWEKGLSFRFVTYYFLIASLLILLGTNR